MNRQKLNVGLDKSHKGHYAKKFECPQCRQRTFVRYYDFDKREYLPEQFGRCDREEHCQYFEAPYEHLKNNRMSNFKKEWKPQNYTHTQPASKIISVDKKIVAQTMQAYEHNNFVKYLISIFGEDQTYGLCEKYYIGTAKNGGTVFWQIDQFLRPRTAQVIRYLPDGHRDKATGAKRMFTINDGFSPCLFGEHLLYESPSDSVVFLVESEKTAIVCSNFYMRNSFNKSIIWMAASGNNGLTEEKIRCLAGREIVLCPDFSYNSRATWGLLPMKKKNSEDINTDYVSVRQRLERLGCDVSFYDPFPEVNDGSDLADYIVDNPPEPQGPDTIKYEMPDFSSLNLPANNHDPAPAHEAALNGKKFFKIIAAGGVIAVEMQEKAYEKRVERMLNQDNIKYMIEQLGINRGSIEPQ